MSFPKTATKIILPLVILAIGIFVTVLLIKSREAPRKEAKERPGALVQVLESASEDRMVNVYATGTVQVDQEVEIIPQVSGRIVEVASGFLAGGFFEKGDLLFAIEAIDYELAVERARSVLAKAESDVAENEGRSRIARLEWDRLNKGKNLVPNPLVLNEPQLKNAKASLAAAKASLRQTELDLERTRIIAPFNCRVRSEQIGPGQYIRSGEKAAVIAGTDTAEIIVPLELSELRWLDISRQSSDENGSEATVSVKVDGSRYTWKGRVVRALGEVDEKSRLTQVVVRVDNPYSSIGGNNNNNSLDLTLGMFVDVVIHGRHESDVTVLPRKALRGPSTVWIMNDDNKLEVRDVKIVRYDKDTVWINEGLDSGDMVILTALSGGSDGMKLRRQEQEAVK